jgi:hypothetical protein
MSEAKNRGEWLKIDEGLWIWRPDTPAHHPFFEEWPSSDEDPESSDLEWLDDSPQQFNWRRGEYIVIND